MTDTKTQPPTPETDTGTDEQFGWTEEDGADAGQRAGTSGSQSGRDWLAQLQAMIENIAEQAGPVLREVSAKAAELAAIAGEKAGPVAARAAELTAEAGTKLAGRSRDLAAELRRDATTHHDGVGAASNGSDTGSPEDRPSA